MTRCEFWCRPALTTAMFVIVSALCSAQDVPGVGSLSAQPPAESESLEEVLVSGEHAGPGLWKISKGSHILWILGTHSPLPKQMLWRSKEVAAAISASAAVLGPFSVSLKVRDPDPLRSKQGKLKNLLTRGDYAHWCALRDKYLGSSPEVETMLPAAAALLLQVRAFEHAGLTYTGEVWSEIARVANEYGVPIFEQANLSDEVIPAHRRVDRSQRAGVRYLLQTMNRLEVDIAEARARANAWAVGDVAALMSRIETDASYANSLAFGWPYLSDADTEWLLAQSENKLLAAVERAMNRNQITFAAFPMHLLLRENGVLQRLRAIGYQVQNPR